MKKYLLLILALLSLFGQAQTNPTFSLTNTSGTNYITCINTSVNYVATSTANLTYVWVSSSATLSGSSVSLTVPGNYSVTATDTLNHSSFQFLSVLVNTMLPVSSVSPNIQSITCSSPTAQFIIIVSPVPGYPVPANQTQSITSPYGSPYILNTNASFLYQTNAPGTYTYVQHDNNNGCSVVKQFTVLSGSGFPTYSITSPQNFTLGCNSKSVAVINIVNAQTTPTPGGTISYSLLGGFGVLSSYSITSPGIYTVAVKDNGTNCVSQTLFSVIQNTTLPQLSVSVPKQILDCNVSQTTLNATSSTANTSLLWQFTGTPGSVIGNTVSVQSNSASPSSTLINTYTISITDNSSTCKSMSVIPMYQNTFKPHASISSGGNTALTCLSPTLILVNTSSTGIPPSTGFPTNLPIIGSLWSGPTNSVNSSTYLVQTPGIYSLEVQDLNNGCKSQTTIVIADNRVYPQINLPGSFFLACPGMVTLSAFVVGTTAGMTYTWLAPFNASVSSLNSPIITTNSPGYYTLVVTNNLTGCSSTASTVVQACVGLESNVTKSNFYKIFPNPNNGVFTLETAMPGENRKIDIYNSIGTFMRSEVLSGNTSSINLSDLAKGLYLVYITQNHTLLYSSKCMIQ